MQLQIVVSEAEKATILAALRIYQQQLNLRGGAVPSDVFDIANVGGTVDPLDDFEIDALCERIN
ncbi:hypothetical protein ACTOWA_00535 [Herbaspirillum seropedicae]|uniref:hypothetical protein n=1 Tax=Herbaspirillum seropedicae TaxID=964 RepID=UPI0028643941|nr:hypothetical protein [Herbaspirillum seropedicae]MDR6397920.1 hypothetical protein [Herbaspirillum seropedicae]